MITYERAAELFSYDPQTGSLVWIKPTSNRIKVGDSVGCKKTISGHIVTQVDGVRCAAHQIAWLLTFGVWPISIVDHINGNPSDNRIANLRLATFRQNLCNSKRPKHNKSGVKGVYWDASRQRWHAQIQVYGRSKSLGRFVNIDEAADAYRKAATQEFGEFARFA